MPVETLKSWVYFERKARKLAQEDTQNEAPAGEKGEAAQLRAEVLRMKLETAKLKGERDLLRNLAQFCLKTIFEQPAR